MAEIDEFINEYNSLEQHRTFRNRWLAAGVGGAAIGASVGVVTGQIGIGAAVAAGSLLAVEGMVLDAQDAVESTRRKIASLVEENSPQPELEPPSGIRGFVRKHILRRPGEQLSPQPDL